VPFIRYTRDKRGYESTYVMHAYRPGQGPQRARVLYLFRTPAHVTIGRKALEPEVTEALEHTHPDLSFDWTNIPSERPAEAYDPRDGRDRDRRDRSHASHARPPQRPPRQAPAVAPPATPPVIEDESPLGRVVGAARAATIRARYGELMQRIGRRARTPEDRDRLTERMQRLNPEEWADEAAVRAVVETVEAEWEGISAELPSRRRGRRGGRHRREDADASLAPASTPPGTGPDHGVPERQAGEPSGIIEIQEIEEIEKEDDEENDQADLAVDASAGPRHRGEPPSAGTDADPAGRDTAAQPDDPDAGGPAGARLPGDR
jgi:hypothetical protein